ncbi:MAG TPA: hypothetical protein VKX33_04920 [Cyclobacteriaceae bacterium]|nr:hypothetical protein [Cyclobacteriaceae bacterium]
MINSFKITTILFGLLNIGLFILWLWDLHMMGTLFGIEISGEGKLMSYFFLALGLFALASSAIDESRSRVIFLLVILVISFIALIANIQPVLEGKLTGMAFITVAFMILGMASLWNERTHIDETDNA